jgi:hypothetical protein
MKSNAHSDRPSKTGKSTPGGPNFIPKPMFRGPATRVTLRDQTVSDEPAWCLIRDDLAHPRGLHFRHKRKSIREDQLRPAATRIYPYQWAFRSCC